MSELRGGGVYVCVWTRSRMAQHGSQVRVNSVTSQWHCSDDHCHRQTEGIRPPWTSQQYLRHLTQQRSVHNVTWSIYPSVHPFQEKNRLRDENGNVRWDMWFGDRVIVGVGWWMWGKGKGKRKNMFFRRVIGTTRYISRTFAKWRYSLIVSCILRPP